VNHKEHENCRIQLLVAVIFHRLNQNRKSDGDALRELCIQSSQSADC